MSTPEPTDHTSDAARRERLGREARASYHFRPDETGDLSDADRETARRQWRDAGQFARAEWERVGTRLYDLGWREAERELAALQPPRGGMQLMPEPMIATAPIAEALGINPEHGPIKVLGEVKRLVAELARLREVERAAREYLGLCPRMASVLVDFGAAG